MLIKVIDNIIYIVGNEVDGKVLRKSFSINYSVGKRDISVSDKYETIRTPDSFILSEFMDFAMRPEFKLYYKKEK